MVPAGVLTSKFSGFISLIFPVKILTLPDLIVVRSLPVLSFGSKINSSIVNSVFDPIVITV